MQLPTRVFAFAVGACALAALSGAVAARAGTNQSESFAVRVPGAANVFAADVGGVKANGGGKKPTIVYFHPTKKQVAWFTSVLGTVSCCSGGTTFNGPQGGTNADGSTDIQSSGGIAGIIHHNRTMFLTGVFVGYPGPSAPGPSRRDVTYDAGKTDIYPQLNQTFYVGSGKVLGAGAYQRFHVPAGANRLVLGFADSFAFHGPPGYYDDDLGELQVIVRVVSAQ